MPAAQIRPTRLEVNDRFPMLGFTIRTQTPGSRAEGGINLGAGIIFGPDGEIGVYGAEQISFGFLGSLSATVQLTVVRGGIESFNGWSFAATLSGGEGPVAGVSALFDSQLSFLGFTAEVGYGLGSPIELYLSVMGQVATQLGVAAAFGATAGGFDADIPLDPGRGGMSIGLEALEVGDIILTTGEAPTSWLIRFGTSGVVSHTMLYVGQGGQVIEAVEQGVVMRPLAEALRGTTVAVAFRVRNLSPTDRQRVADEAARMLDLPYNHWGVVREGAFQIARHVCDLLPPDQREQCPSFRGPIDFGAGNNQSFFCSELVLEAFARAGHPLTSAPPRWASPQNLADLRFDHSRIEYVGHLRAPALARSHAAGLSTAGTLPGHARAFDASDGSIEVDVKFRVFIPSPAVALSLPVIGTRAFGGDGRSFSYDQGTHRGIIHARVRLPVSGVNGRITEVADIACRHRR